MEGLEEQYPLQRARAPYQNVHRQEENEEENDGIVDEITRSDAKESSKPLVPCGVESLNCSEIPAFVLRYLYVGHFTARWGTRMWEFSVGLFMINVWPASLLLAAIYGVVESASVAILGTYIGDWVDRTPYIKVLRVWLGLQNLSFIVAGAAVVALLIDPAGSAIFGGRTFFIGLVVLINASGAVGALASLAGSILVERDWVVIIAKGKSPTLLTKMNAILRRIDLSCKLLAPIVVGLVMSYTSMITSAIFLVLWNVFSILLEYWLLSSVYYAILTLNLDSERDKNIERNSLEEHNVHSDKDVNIAHLVDSDEENNLLQEENPDMTTWKQKILQICLYIINAKAWVIYIQQDVLLAALALAILYFTVLSFGTLMIANLEWKGIPAYVLGLSRGLSAIVGIAATLIYPILYSYIQLLYIGLWAIWFQWCSLLICVASIWVHKEQLAAWMLMGGVVVSRLGLWMFDLSVLQQMQDSVPTKNRGVVAGVQHALQSFMDLMNYVMGIVISNPKDFQLLILISFLSITCALILYIIHTYQIRFKN